MAFRLVSPTTATATAAALLGAGLVYHQHHPSTIRRTLFPPHRCESLATAIFPLWGSSSSRTRPMAPPPRNRSGYDPTVYRQISTGSFVGLAAGLYVARFGKTLCWIFGAVMLLVEALARQGFDVLPPGRIKRWVEQVDVRGLVLRNMPFKVSFGTSFVIASMYG